MEAVCFTVFHISAQRKKLRDISYDDMEMGKTSVVYFQTQLTLNLLSYILLFVVLAVLFDAKSTKNFGIRKKSSQAPFAHAT